MKMHIGIDFDNTIVTYNQVFYKYALKLGLISGEVEKNKQAIRDSIRMLPNGNDRWTELQAHVYGSYMNEAEPAEGVERFLRTCKERSVKVSIISHKTIYPALGPPVNLRQAARKWLENRGFLSGADFALSETDVAFEGTLEEKLARITQRKCTHFIDDLVDVLIHPEFPTHVERILYASKGGNSLPKGIRRFRTWDDIRVFFFG